MTLLKCSRWHATRPVGTTIPQEEFLNGVAWIESSLEPEALLELLQRIEVDHGRKRLERWAPRTVDLDLLLYDDFVIETESLRIPHPRMSFRRFVLDPAVEVAPDWVHPTIGWTLGQLRRHLDAGTDALAIVSQDESLRDHLVARIVERTVGRPCAPPSVGQLADRWPKDLTTWVSLTNKAGAGGSADSTLAASVGSDRCSTANLPKLTVLLDPTPDSATPDADEAWNTLANRPGRGPTLRVPPCDAKWRHQDAFAAIESVWPGLCSLTRSGIE